MTKIQPFKNTQPGFTGSDHYPMHPSENGRNLNIMKE
jgi:hypothetical protein